MDDRTADPVIPRVVAGAFGFAGKMTILSSGANVPDEFYAAQTIVGATDVADILDVSRLQPGTIIIDDSAPHRFDVGQARKRFDRHADILFTEGWVLAAPTTITQTAFVPLIIAATLNADLIAILAHRVGVFTKSPKLCLLVAVLISTSLIEQLQRFNRLIVYLAHLALVETLVRSPTEIIGALVNAIAAEVIVADLDDKLRAKRLPFA